MKLLSLQRTDLVDFDAVLGLKHYIVHIFYKIHSVVIHECYLKKSHNTSYCYMCR